MGLTLEAMSFKCSLNGLRYWYVALQEGTACFGADELLTYRQMECSAVVAGVLDLPFLSCVVDSFEGFAPATLGMGFGLCAVF